MHLLTPHINFPIYISTLNHLSLSQNLHSHAFWGLKNEDEQKIKEEEECVNWREIRKFIVISCDCFLIRFCVNLICQAFATDYLYFQGR